MSGFRAAGTALSHYRNLGRDSALPPLGLASGVAAAGAAVGNACETGRTGSDAHGTAGLETVAAEGGWL